MFNRLKFQLNSETVLRVGLGLTLLYAGVGGLVNSQSWVGFIPDWVGAIVSREVFLLLHSIVQIILAIGIIGGIQLKILSLVAFFDVISILVFYGIDEITFRDFGLAMMALALFLENKERRWF